MRKLAARDGPASAILEALSRLSVVYQVMSKSAFLYSGFCISIAFPQDSSLIGTGGGGHHHRRPSDAEGDEEGSGSSVTTEPSRWPGVASLRALLDREKDEETPALAVLLCETFVAVYMSLLSYALASCDAQVYKSLDSPFVSTCLSVTT